MYDAILIVSFGGPEKPEDVRPFLENVLRGKNVPVERMLEVEQHYMEFGGVSPINQQCRDLIAALEKELSVNGPKLPIYWGNRNWHPMLEDTIRKMAEDGVKRAIAFFTSTFSCYSGCRQYRENIAEAQAKVGPTAPRIDKLRMPYNHPGFILPQTELLLEAIAKISQERRDKLTVLFTAHSIPMSMAENSDYEKQLREAARLIAEGAGHERWELVFQSRSGPPQQPWLEPDVCDRIQALHDTGEATSIIIVQPIGFVSDHMEVIYDLDHEAGDLCQELQVEFVRAATIGVHPRFIQMIRELIVERSSATKDRPALGKFPANHDVCPENCCPYPRPQRPASAGTS